MSIAGKRLVHHTMWYISTMRKRRGVRKSLACCRMLREGAIRDEGIYFVPEILSVTSSYRALAESDGASNL